MGKSCACKPYVSACVHPPALQQPLLSPKPPQTDHFYSHRTLSSAVILGPLCNNRCLLNDMLFQESIGKHSVYKTMLAFSHIRAGIKTEILSSHEIISGAFFANYPKGNRAWSPLQDRITLGLTCLTHRTHSRGQNKIVLCNGRSRDVNNIPHCSHWR